MKKVNEVSALAGVSKRTLQYYDDQGLLVVDRTENNYRLFDDEALERVWEILVYRKMKLELNEIKEVLSMNKTQRNHFFEEREKIMKVALQEMRNEIDFVRAVQLYGIPRVGNAEKTYIEQIDEIKKTLIDRYRREYR